MAQNGFTTDCHWSGSPTRASGPLVIGETGGGASGVPQVL